MSLSAGQQLLHYRIVEKIGEGGMGAVWKAIDTSLDRPVAIKILPDEFARHPERLARFEREAKMLAALNHPGIAAVYSVHEAAGMRFLAMELVAGEDLDQRLATGPLPMPDALDIARQLAEALEAAHERGVIHRDLKPANVRLTPEGRVKVLDLGLAKALDSSAPASGDGAALSRSPTVTSGGTMAGVILGTAAYMSPEQAKGVPVDRRADIWAFGVVLYQMLTGRRLFEGETVSEVMAAVLRADIDLEALPRDTPAAVRRLLRRCLERDPRRRLRDMGDARLELEGHDEPAGPVATGRSGIFSGRALAAVLAVAAAVVLAAVWLAGRTMTPGPVPVTRFALYEIGMPIDGFQGLAISPDGRRLVFRARDADGRESLHVRSMDSEEVRALPGTEQGWLPFFSPDGEQVGFFHRGKLATVSIAGGMARTMAEFEDGFSGGAWLADGSIVFTFSASARLGKISPSGGPIDHLEVPDVGPGGMVISPWPLPGGRAVLCSVGRGASYDVAVYDLVDGSLRVIAENGFTPTYSASGHVIFQQGSDGPLMALPFDASKRRVTGAAFPVLAEVGARVSYQVRMFTVADNGTLAYIPRSSLLDSGALVWVDQQGQATPIVEIGKVITEPRLSFDDKRIAFRTPAPNCDIWVHDLERGATTRITHEADSHGASWSPDGSRLAFCRLDGTDWRVLTANSDGSGTVEPLSPAVFPRGFTTAYSPDGAFILVVSQGEATGLDVSLVSTGDGKVQPLLSSRFDEGSATFSPDGRYIAYVSDESGRPEVYVSAFPGLDARVQISTDGGTEPVWPRQGNRLFFRSDRRMLAVDTSLDPVFAAGRPRTLFESDYVVAGPVSLPAYDVSSDGKRFVMVRQRSGAAGAEIKVVLGWGQTLDLQPGAPR